MDKYQKKAVLSKKKYALVLAPAGSGKTYTIVERINYLIENRNIKESEILAISFTNDAVNNLKERLKYNIDVLTFHKLALEIIGKKKEILSEDMLYDVINESFNNYSLLALYKINKEDIFNIIHMFINRFKSLNLKIDIFYKWINRTNGKEKVFLKEILKIYICYESYLEKENLIDFNDMINLAIKEIDYCALPYKYILIDEYQDISYSKFLLIRKILNKNKGELFAVGDDYQSIYAFAGSDIRLITRFKLYFFFSKIYILNNTYRNSKELLKISNKFINKNYFQIRKNTKSKIKVNNAVNIVYYSEINDAINKILISFNIKELLILGRNNKDIVGINNNSTKMTVHKSKGLESEYVFVININDSKNGFPCKIKDHDILRFVKNKKKEIKYAEERRLFYVALTRCKKKVFLFVPINNESIFIKEIKKYKIVNLITLDNHVEQK